MKRDFILELTADNNFSILNRIINVLNRRRVRIKRLVAHENDQDFKRGGATLHLFTTLDMMEKVKHQLEKLIEVDTVTYHETEEFINELSENVNT